MMGRNQVSKQLIKSGPNFANEVSECAQCAPARCVNTLSDSSDPRIIGDIASFIFPVGFFCTALENEPIGVCNQGRKLFPSRGERGMKHDSISVTIISSWIQT